MSVAKAFDLVHKVADSDDDHPTDDSRVPFDEGDSGDKETPPAKKRTKVEIIFFYLLLFAIFFIMGVMFLSPTLFKGKPSKTAVNQSPPASNETPIPGFTIEKQGQDSQQAAKDLGLTSPSPVASSQPSTAPVAPSSTATAKIQILNGTSTTGAAAALQQKLAQKGIVVDSVGNYKKRTVAKTTVYYMADYKTAAQQVLAVTGGIMVETTSATTGDHNILIVTGKTH